MSTRPENPIFPRSLVPFAVLPFAVATMLVAQSTAPATAPATPSAAATALLENLVAPLHTQAADPIGGEYGVWGAGPRYKASFHGDFTSAST